MMEDWQIKRGNITISPLKMGVKFQVFCSCGGRTVKRNVVKENGEDFNGFWDGTETRKIRLVCVRCGKTVKEPSR